MYLKIIKKLTFIRISCYLSDRKKLLLFSYKITIFWLILHLNCYNFEIDFDLFQEAIAFKTTKKFLRKLYSIIFFKHFQVILNSSLLIITLLSFIRKIWIPFDFNTNKKFPTNVFNSVGKKKSYLCFQAGSATMRSACFFRDRF